MKKQHKQSNYKKLFHYSLIASAVIGASTNSAMAQQEKPEAEAETEIVEIKGVRGNLHNAQVMKMSADTVMDALSAEDMGSLADRSVLEAISRIPGVAIERFAAANDPDHFGVEGGGVVVRGLTHVRSEFNHRDSFSADSGRGLSFEDVSPELMGSVQVYKNQTADMIEGGIAGTVNLNTRKPFDSDSRVIALSTDVTYTDMRGETAPTFSGLFSDVWKTDAGKVGFLINYSNADVQVQSDGVQVGRYRPQNRDANLWVPESTRLSRKQDDRGREGFATSVQFENTDKTLLLTGEFIRSEATLSWAENIIEWAGSTQNDLFPVAGTEFETTNDGLYESGIITSEAGWRGDGAPYRAGPQHVFATRARGEESVVEDFSFNVKYKPNDSWAFQFDAQFIDASMDIEDVSVGAAERAVVGMDLTGSDVGKVNLFGGLYDGQADYTMGTPFQDPANYFYRHAMDHVSDNVGDELALRFDTVYTFDDGEMKSAEFGARYSNREQTTRQSTYNWGVISEAWTGGFERLNDSAIPYDEVTFDNFARGDTLTVEGGPTFLFPAIEMVGNYDGLAGALSSANPGWIPLAQRGGAEGHFIPSEINKTEETSTAIYAKLNFEGELKGLEYSANIGLRYVKLENDTHGFISFPDDQPEDPSDLTDPYYFIPDSQRNFGNGHAEEMLASSEYTNVLPSVNFKLNLTDELLFRFGFSEAIALPSLGNLRNYVSIEGKDMRIVYDENSDVDNPDERIPVAAAYERYTASSGNPYLKPMESYNWDASLEYYFAEAGSVTFSAFYKDLSNYFINGVTMRDYSNNGATQTVAVAGATNGDEGSIKGWEFAYQQFFDNLPGIWSGLGASFNYTHISEEGSPNEGLSDDAADSNDAGDIAFSDSLPLEGLSKSTYNAAIMYEKYGISARVAYGWRDDYLLTTRDVITTLPIFNKANGALDASVFWEIDDNWKVGIQGTNLNNNITETTMQYNEAGDQATRSWFINDRRYSLVVRANF